MSFLVCFFFFSSRRRHTRYWRDWSSDVCSSDLAHGDVPLRAKDLSNRPCRSIDQALRALGEEYIAADDRVVADVAPSRQDRKSTRLNSSHANISYAVFCLKKKIINPTFYLITVC